MSRRYVNQLTQGDPVDEAFLVTEKQLRVNRQGGLYLGVELRDKTGRVQGRLWNATEEQARRFEVGDLLQVKGKTQVFQGALQIIISQFDPIEPSSLPSDEFLPQPPQDSDRLLARLREILKSVANPYLQGLIQCFLIDDDFLKKFLMAPAGIKNHHAYLGGLIEHVVALLNLADRVAELYPELDRDLLLAGVFLHDIAKIDELEFDSGFGYSDQGQLVGHLVMGVEMLNQKAAECAKLMDEPFPAELLLQLKHMIVSHHGTYEFGSPKLPMTLEAVALHYLDNLDAKIHLFSREIKDDPGESSWTPFQQTLGRRIYKGASAPPTSVGLES